MQFKTSTVLTVVSGVMLEREGFGLVHILMDHLVPEIRAHQIPAFSDRMRAALVSQYRPLMRYTEAYCRSVGLEKAIELAEAQFGEYIDVAGPA